MAEVPAATTEVEQPTNAVQAAGATAAAPSPPAAAAAAAVAAAAAQLPQVLTIPYRPNPSPKYGLEGRIIISNRVNTLKNLLSLVASKGFVVVQGPSASGKTSLYQQLPAVAAACGWGRVIRLCGSEVANPTTIDKLLGAKRCQTTWEKLWDTEVSTPITLTVEPVLESQPERLLASGSNSMPVEQLQLVLIDDAQYMFKPEKDETFWANLRQLEQGASASRTVRIIMFAVSGNCPSSLPSVPPVETLCSIDRAALKLTFKNGVYFKASTGSADQHVQLALHREEFDELWSNFKTVNNYQNYFQDSDLMDVLYELTAGHVGLLSALWDRMGPMLKGLQGDHPTGAGDKALRNLFSSGEVYWVMQDLRGLRKPSQEGIGFYSTLYRQQPIMQAIWAAGEGGCSEQDILNTWTAANASESISDSITQAGQHLRWLHQLGFVLYDPAVQRYRFFMPLHYSYYLTRLSVFRDSSMPTFNIPGSRANFIDLLRHSIQLMSWNTMLNSLSRCSRSNDQNPGRQWQVEWYKSIVSLMYRNCPLMPDVGKVFGSKGKVEFWVQRNDTAQEGWVIELLVHGTQAGQAGGDNRSSVAGAKYSPLPVTKHAVIDFWLAEPKPLAGVVTDLLHWKYPREANWAFLEDDQNYFVVYLDPSKPQASLYVPGAQAEVVPMKK